MALFNKGNDLCTYLVSTLITAAPPPVSLKAGQLIAAAEEERFNRSKYWAGFPVQSIKFVLGKAGIPAPIC